MPLAVCYEIYLSRDGGRDIFLTRVRDASTALNIARYQVDTLNASWLRRVAWTSRVAEALIEEDRLGSDDDVVEPLTQGDKIDGQVRRPYAGAPADV